jgi:hypothetical protein
LAHLRKQIRDNVVTALTGLSTTGSRVYGSRVYPMAAANLPGLCVYARRGQCPASIYLHYADLPDGAASGDAITIDGTAYTVRVIQPEGTGVTTLALEKN